MNVQNFNQIFTKMKNYMINNQKKINDFNDGSIISTSFESVARIIERLYIDARNGYSNSLKQIVYSIFNFKKKTGSKATAYVIFSRSVAIPNQSNIPTGTQISSGGYIFFTTAAGKINANEINSGSIPCIAAQNGVDYNVSANSITNIDSALSADIVSVNNPARANGGADDEKEVAMFARFKDWINGLQGTNSYGFKSTVLAVPGVRSVSIVEQFPLYLNIYSAIVYVDDGTGNLPDDLRNEIETAINGEDSSVHPGCRATGINVLVSAASPVNISINVTVKVYRVDYSIAIFEVKQALAEEINNLLIGDDVIITSLILKLRRIGYVKDVPTLTLDGLSTNVTINDNQIARTTVGDINVTVVNA